MNQNNFHHQNKQEVFSFEHLADELRSFFSKPLVNLPEAKLLGNNWLPKLLARVLLKPVVSRSLIVISLEQSLFVKSEDIRNLLNC